MAKQPTAWTHGATARFQNNPLKQREFEQLCVELQAEYRAKTRSEFELIKNLATEFMRADLNAAAEEALLSNRMISQDLSSILLDGIDSDEASKMLYAKNHQAGRYEWATDESKQLFLRELGFTHLLSQELALLSANQRHGSLHAVIEETDFLGIQLRAIIINKQLHPDLAIDYLERRPGLIADIKQGRWFNIDFDCRDLPDLPSEDDTRLRRFNENLFADCIREFVAYQIHLQMEKLLAIQSRATILTEIESDRFRRYATSSTNAVSKLIKALRETIYERERREEYLVSST